MRDPFSSLLASMGSSDGAFDNKKDAYDAIKEFQNVACDFEPGDAIERNKFGAEKYSMPNDRQAAVFVRHIKPRINNDQIVNGVILVAVEKDDVRELLINTRYYKKAIQPSKNITFFRGKK